jgi:hypothetical protein
MSLNFRSLAVSFFVVSVSPCVCEAVLFFGILGIPGYCLLSYQLLEVSWYGAQNPPRLFLSFINCSLLEALEHCNLHKVLRG